MAALPPHVPSTVQRPLPTHSAERLDMVLRELRKRARHHPAPHLITQAIEGLEAELGAVRRQLKRG